MCEPALLRDDLARDIDTFPPSAMRKMDSRRWLLVLGAGVAIATRTDQAAAQRSSNGGSTVLALRGGTVHTAAGSVIQNGTIIIRDGKIADVGSRIAIPADARV